MFEFNVMFVFSTYLYLSIVFECESALPKHPCQQLRPINGQARLLLVRGVTMAKITCFQPYVLINGNETMTCVEGKWDSKYPICAKYDPIHIPCNFESPEERFCGWRNYMYNEIEWLADKMPVLANSTRSHVTPGSSQYFTTDHYISLDTRDYGSTTIGQLLSPSLPPVATKQRCVQFSYKVTSGNSHSRPTLKVIFGGIPHWETHEGEGRVIIGLYQFNVSNKIVIEGSSCKAAIDNLIITEDNYSCTQRPYDEELDSCHDNCGKISHGVGCSCDWSCHYNNNCCPDIQIKCPYIKPIDDITRLYLTSNTTTTVSRSTTVKNNSIHNFSCTFESKVATFCGWKNDIFNNADWLADQISFIFFNHHVIPGSSDYFSSNYISLDAGNDGPTLTGRLLSPPIVPIKNNQRCLIFAYRVTSGNSNSIPILKVTFSGIPHWETHEGEGRAIIGLYQFNISSRIVIEGKSCKAAIDNIIITEGNSCNKRPYVEEIDSCHDNCGKISDGVGCSCDWSCHNNNNCCPDIQNKCPYIKPMDDIANLYLATTATTTLTTTTASEKNEMLNVTIPKNEDSKSIKIGGLTLVFGSRVLMHQTPFNSTDIAPTLNPTFNGLITRRSSNIVDYLNNKSISDTNLTNTIQANSENSVIPLQHNQTLKANAFPLNNYSGLPAVATESTNLFEKLNVNNIVGLSYVYDAIYIIGYLAAVGVTLFIVKHSFYFIKSLIKKRTDANDQFVETKNERSSNIGLASILQK